MVAVVAQNTRLKKKVDQSYVSKFEPEEGVLPHQKPRPEQHEHDGAEAEVQKVLHDDVARVLCAREACFHHGKPCLHEPDEDGADQKPNARRSENVHKITSKICS